MEIHIKKAVKAGNSSAVILPKAWLNQEVRVELVKKTQETMLIDVINILKPHIKLGKVIGIYLVGSYAGGEEEKDSDIDILVISDNIDKEMIHDRIYNILIVSQELLKQKLERDLFPLGSMIREAIPLFNESYLSSIKTEVTKNNINWYINTTEKKLNLIKKSLEKTTKNPDNKLIYTLILRIRTFYIIQKMIDEKPYSKKEFLKLISRISGGRNAYNSYLSVKNNTETENKTTREEAEKLYNYLKKQLEQVKRKL